jgi:cadmium resistance protein CadD (predicted permease)
VYTPVFATLGARDTAITVGVFALGVALWCLLGSWLVSHRTITALVQRGGHGIVPAVLILIGLYIFDKAGVL